MSSVLRAALLGIGLGGAGCDSEAPAAPAEVAPTPDPGASSVGVDELVSSILGNAHENAGVLELNFPALSGYRDPGLVPGIPAGPPRPRLEQPSASAAARQADGKLVRLRGYMIVLAMDGKKVREFVLAANTAACCFGKILEVDEMVHVVSQEPVDFLEDRPVEVIGVFHVAPERDDLGEVVSLYRLRANTLRPVR